MTTVGRWLVRVLAGALAAAALLAAAYWGFRQLQPRPLFTPATTSEPIAAQGATTGGAQQR
jgi:hypothetical protein